MSLATRATAYLQCTLPEPCLALCQMCLEESGPGYAWLCPCFMREPRRAALTVRGNYNLHISYVMASLHATSGVRECSYHGSVQSIKECLQLTANSVHST